MKNEEKTIKVSKKFREEFELVTKHYNFPPEEIEWLRKQARKDYAMVSRSLAAIAAEIESGVLDKKGIDNANNVIWLAINGAEKASVLVQEMRQREAG
jgi:hypothetical protein